MSRVMINIENVTKTYKLGQINGTTLRDELQRKRAKRLHREDPTKKIGTDESRIGETFKVLDSVSFKVNEGERVGIIGHNGAGKSTLLKLISRITAPSDGEIGLNGRVTSMLEVGTGFHGELTGRENIYMNGAILGMTKKEIDERIEDIIEFSECRQFIDTPVKRYSSGMYVKLAFSVAAHLNSEIMIMDEVLAVGDMAFQKKCLNKMNDVSRREGRTILYVSHNMNTIRQLCDRCIVLDKGKVIFDGDVDKAIGIYMGSKNDLAVFSDLSELPRESIGDYKMKMQSVSILNNAASITDNDDLSIKLKYSSSFTCDDLAFRAIIFNSSTEPVGMAASGECIKALTGENSVSLTLSLPMLCEGIYSARIVLYEVDDFGNEIIHDVVGNAFTFEKSIHTPKNNTSKRWSNRVWGDIVFPTIRSGE